MRYGTAVVIGSALSVAGMSGVASAAVIAKYNFDSLSGSPTANVVKDVSLNGHDVTLGGTFSLSNADPFDPTGAESSNKSLAQASNSTSDGPIASPNTIDLSGGKFTMEGWAQSANQNNIIMQLDAGSGSSASQIYIRLTKTGTNSAGSQAGVVVKGSGASTGTIFSNATLATSGTGWNHIAVTYDGTDVKLYVNGALDKTVNKPGLVFQNSFASGSVGDPLKGQIDDVLLANTVYALGNASTPNTIMYDYTHSFSQVPEPASMALLGLGGLMLIRRRRKA